MSTNLDVGHSDLPSFFLSFLTFKNIFIIHSYLLLEQHLISVVSCLSVLTSLFKMQDKTSTQSLNNMVNVLTFYNHTFRTDHSNLVTIGDKCQSHLLSSFSKSFRMTIDNDSLSWAKQQGLWFESGPVVLKKIAFFLWGRQTNLITLLIQQHMTECNY